jgi:ribonuclease VapC
MVLDTSAIVAAILGEPDGPSYRQAMLDAHELAISTVTVLETRIVLHARFGSEAVREFDEMLKQAGILVTPFDEAMTDAAFEAFRQYGKGQGAAAQLNFGDCAAYALAKISGEPLLFKGDDFSRTDIGAALPRG